VAKRGLEAKFSAQFRTELKEFYGDRIFVQLFPDMMRTGKKPFDFFVIYRKEFFGFECKAVKGKTFNVKRIAPHQTESLQRIEDAGGYGRFLIYFKEEKTAVIVSTEDMDYLAEMFGDSLKLDMFVEKLSQNKIIRRVKFGGKTSWNVIRYFGEINKDD